MIKLQRNLFEGDGRITQRFGEHLEWYEKFGMKGHNGIDYGIPTGTKLYSCIIGTCTETAYDKNGYGYYIKIENDECGVLYGHMRELTKIKVGESVLAGQELGVSGNSGNSTGPHLHFGVFPKPRDRSNGYAGYIDPLGHEIEWVESLDEAESVLESKIEALEAELSEMRESRNRWRSSSKEWEGKYSEKVLAMNKVIEENEMLTNKVKILEKEKEVANMPIKVETKQVIWEALKEPLRLLVLAIIPVAITFLTGLDVMWAAPMVALLRFIDKFLHELGKAESDENLIKGLTRF